MGWLMAKEFVIIDNSTLNRCFSELAQLKQPFTVKVVQKRSLPANALFHVWCGELADHLTNNAVRFGLVDDIGLPFTYDKETVKGIMKELHGVWKEVKNPVTGVIERRLKSTADYDDAEMYALMQGMKSTSLHIYGFHLVSKGQFLDWCEQQL